MLRLLLTIALSSGLFGCDVDLVDAPENRFACQAAEGCDAGPTIPQSIDTGFTDAESPANDATPDAGEIGLDAINETGATPSSLISILEALKSSGSLRAELVVI